MNYCGWRLQPLYPQRQIHSNYGHEIILSDGSFSFLLNSRSWTPKFGIGALLSFNLVTNCSFTPLEQSNQSPTRIRTRTSECSNVWLVLATDAPDLALKWHPRPPGSMQTFPHPSDGKGNSRSACDRCRRHKLRCERPSDSMQCRRCSKANVTCVTGTALKSGRPPQRRQPSDALGTWSLHQTLQTPIDTPDTDSGTGREMQLPLSPVNLGGFENGWPDTMQQDIDASQTFQPLVNTYQPVYSHIISQNDCLKRLGDLQREVLADLELAKACKTATDCPQFALPPELAYNSSFLVGRMLEHSKTLLDILDSFGSISQAPTSSDADCPPTLRTCTGSLHGDVPTMFSLFSCYICLIRIYRTIFSCIHDSMPVLLGLQQPLPQLFPGIHLAGFTLETRLDLQVQILVQVSEDMLAKLEARFGNSEGTTVGQGIFEPTRAARMLSMMLEEEANEQPPLYEPRGPCESLKNILANLRRMTNAGSANTKDLQAELRRNLQPLRMDPGLYHQKSSDSTPRSLRAAIK